MSLPLPIVGPYEHAYLAREARARIEIDKQLMAAGWLVQDTDNLPSPEVIAAEIVKDLQAALAEFTAVAESLGSREK